MHTGTSTGRHPYSPIGRSVKVSVVGLQSGILGPTSKRFLSQFYQPALVRQYLISFLNFTVIHEQRREHISKPHCALLQSSAEPRHIDPLIPHSEGPSLLVVSRPRRRHCNLWSIDAHLDHTTPIFVEPSLMHLMRVCPQS